MMNQQSRDEKKHAAVSDISEKDVVLSQEVGCPSKEELADMAANLCSAEQRKKLEEHFASCKTCYNDWVALCFQMAAMSRGVSERKSLTTIRVLGCLCFVGALVFCIVVFLMIKP